MSLARIKTIYVHIGTFLISDLNPAMLWSLLLSNDHDASDRVRRACETFALIECVAASGGSKQGADHHVYMLNGGT
jgi:hypothetical protein